MLEAAAANQIPADETLVLRSEALPSLDDTMWNIIHHPDLRLRQSPTTPATAMKNRRKNEFGIRAGASSRGVKPTAMIDITPKR
jgi:hypothetical protein